MEDQTYVKVLEYRKRSAIISFNTMYFLLTEVILIGMAFILGRITSDNTSATLIFVLMIIYILGFTIVFVDTFFNLNIFYSRRNTIGILFLLSSVLVVLAMIILDYFNLLFRGDPGELITTLLFGTLLVNSVMTFYFLYQAKPLGEDKTLVGKFETIREELRTKPLSAMGIGTAIERATKWLQYEQDEEGYWHFTTPLYETAEILETLFGRTNDLSYQWQAVFNGVEETRTVEQVFFNVLDANNTSMFSENYFNLYPRKVIGMINTHIQNPKASTEEEAIEKIRSFTPIEDERYDDLRKKTRDLSSWDFINILEKGSTDPDFEIPALFALGPITTLRMENKDAQIIADIISETFNIVLSRATTRFNMRGEKQDVSNLVLGLMYNTLIEMRSLNQLMRSKLDAVLSGRSTETATSSSGSPDIPSIVLPGLENEAPVSPNVETSTPDPSIPVIPTIDGGMPDVPNFGGQEQTSASEEKDENKISIDLRLGFARKHILKKQEIDGGWGGDALTSAECLRAIAHNESVESESVKMGVNFLLAIQKSNGSWGDDYVVTARVIRALNEIQSRVMVQF